MHETPPADEQRGTGQAPDPAWGHAHPPSTAGPPEEWVRRPVGDFDPRHRSPRSAALLSIFPGLGQIYIGLYARGAALAAVAFLLLLSAFAIGDDLGPAIIWALFFTWMFSMIDAGRMAALYNYAIAGGEEIEMPQDIRLPRLGGSIAAGTVLVAFSSIALSYTRFNRPLDWLVAWWPAFPLALGGYLLARGILDHLNADTATSDRSGPPPESLQDDLAAGNVEQE